MKASVVDLARLSFAYEEIGATAGHLPAGYHHLERTESLAEGRAAFDAAVDALFGWQMHRGAGIELQATATRAAPGVDALLEVGAGPLTVTDACRVVSVRDELDRQGFTYGTLTGSPEAGEAAFDIVLGAAGAVSLEIVAFSRPIGLARLGRPLLPLVLGVATNRYVDALRRAAATVPEG